MTNIEEWQSKYSVATAVAVVHGVPVAAGLLNCPMQLLTLNLLEAMEPVPHTALQTVTNSHMLVHLHQAPSGLSPGTPPLQNLWMTRTQKHLSFS